MLRSSRALGVAVVAVLAAATLHADDDKYVETVRKTLSFRGGTVSLANSFGSVVVRPGSGNTVDVRATVRSSDPAFGKTIQIIASEDANGVSVATRVPDVHIRNGSLSYSIDYVAEVPASAPLNVENRFGNIDVSGVRGANRITNAQGSIVVREVKGNQRIENSFGSVRVSNAGDVVIRNNNGTVNVEDVGSADIADRFGSVSVRTARATAIVSANGTVNVEQIAGPLTVRNSFATVTAKNIRGVTAITNENGSVELHDVTGNAAVNTSFGKATISNIHGNLSATNRNASVTAFEIAGPAAVTTSFGSIDIRNVAGPATLKNSNGNVLASDIRGNLTVDTSFGSVRGENVRGSADIDNSNGSVTLSDIDGNARVHTTFSGTFLKQIGGTIDVESQNGSINVSDLATAACHDISLKTTFASIRVELPSSRSYRVTARTSFGRIHAPDGLTSASTVTDESLSGTIGSGACRLELRNSNGNITIE